MKKAVRKGASKAVALVLSLAMIFGMAPMVSASAGNTADAQDNFDRIVHLDMGRKYFTPDWIKSLIDEMAKLGYNQLELDFGNSQTDQFRFALDNMSVTYTYTEQTMVPVDNTDAQEEPAAPVETGEPVEEQPAAPVQTEEPADEEQTAETVMPLQEEPAAPAETAAPTAPVTDEVLEQVEESGVASSVIEYTYINEEQSDTIDLGTALPAKGEYITEAEMKDIIEHAKSKGIEIVPLLNSPGHFGAVLCAADHAQKNFRYQGSNSLDITNGEAVAFGQAVVLKYAEWFKGQGCDTFNIGADEFANDIYSGGGMGFGHLVQAKQYHHFVDYVNTLADKLQEMGYTVRAFNDGINYGGQTGVENDIQVCYWSNGWGEYDVASAVELEEQGFTLVNTHGDYYYVLRGYPESNSVPSVDKIFSSFSNTSFIGNSTVFNPAGSMFCIWSDVPDYTSENKVMEQVKEPLAAMAYKMQGGYDGTGLTYEQFKQGDIKNVQDAATGVSVLAPGVTTLEVKKEQSVSALDGEIYVAYDMTPKTENGLYTGEAKITIPLGELASYDDSELTGFVVENDGQITKLSGTKTGSDYTFTMPHFSVGGVMLVNEEYDEERTITVGVGQTDTDIIYDVNYAGSYTTDHPNIASVTVTGTNGTESTVSYDKANVSCNDLISRDSDSWQKTNYYYTPDGTNYYPLYAKRNSSWWFGKTYTYTWGYSTTESTNNVTECAPSQQETRDTSDTPNITVYTQRTVPATGPSTTVTVTGLSEGETSVVIGNIKYNIKVTEADLSNVEPLTVEYWITNARVTGDTSDSETIQIEAEQVYGENGVDLSTLVDANGLWGEQPVVLWKTTVLDYNNHQSGDSGDDETADGKDFTRIRYWKDNWQYYYNGNWQNITTSGYRVDQVVAYYLQQTDVTTEVTTFTKDWGYDTTTTTPDTSSGYGQVALAFAVVYPDGTMNPANEDLIYDKATIFNYWGGRNFGIVSVQNNSDYTVSKITITEGTRARNTSRNVWDPSDTINWEKKRLDNGSYWYDETTAWDKSQGGVPTVYGNGYEWTRKNQATLVLIYLEPTQSEDDLTVNYIVEGNSTPFYTFPVKVTNTAGQEEKTFLNSLVNNNKPVQVGSIELDDAAYVTNSSGVNQTFNKNLTTVPALQDTIYGSGLFTYTGAEISQDGKTLSLIYKKNSTSQYQYVLDFGLPVTVPLSELGINPQGVTTVTGTASYGEISYNAGSQSITYTPNSILKTTATAQLIITFGDGEQQKVTVDFIPASTVYYEAEDQSFVYFENGSNMNWTAAGTSGNRTQAAEKLGAKENNYGSDPAYKDNGITWSNKNAQKVTVSKTAFGESGKWPTATFTFTGTGADIISQTDAKAGVILVDVKQGTEAVKTYIVNNYYGYTYSDTGWTVSKDSNGNGIDSIYQVPVIAIRDLDYGTYTVTITVAYDGIFDVASQGSFDFYLDAVRVYNPLESSSVYAADKESDPIFNVLHNLVTNFGKTGTLVDGLMSANEEQFKHFGPNNEVYLAHGQSVTVDLEENASGKNTQVAARLIAGESASLDIGGKSVAVNSTVDQYYTINGGITGSEVTITNNGQGTVALTILKLTGGSN